MDTILQFRITRPELLAQLEERRQAAGHHDFQDTLELVLTESSAWNALPRGAVWSHGPADPVISRADEMGFADPSEPSPPKPKPLAKRNRKANRPARRK